MNSPLKSGRNRVAAAVAAAFLGGFVLACGAEFRRQMKLRREQAARRARRAANEPFVRNDIRRRRDEDEEQP